MGGAVERKRDKQDFLKSSPPAWGRIQTFLPTPLPPTLRCTHPPPGPQTRSLGEGKSSRRFQHHKVRTATPADELRKFWSLEVTQSSQRPEQTKMRSVPTHHSISCPTPGFPFSCASKQDRAKCSPKDQPSKLLWAQERNPQLTPLSEVPKAGVFSFPE